jgi:hypothetical protein
VCRSCAVVVVVVSLPRHLPRLFVPPFVRPPPRLFLPRVPASRLPFIVSCPSSSATSTRDPPHEQWLAGLGQVLVSSWSSPGLVV